MHRPTHRLFAVALVAVLPLALVACGDEEDAADETTTTTSLTSCAEVYTPGDGEPEGADAIESRGAPELTACAPSGELEVIDEVTGSGAEAAADDTITVQYTGVVASSGTKFDSSWDRGAPATFPLNGVIQGWSQGLVGMKEGGRRTLVIPAELAYGDAPPPGSGIAAGDTLVFTVDLVSVGEAPTSTTTTSAPAASTTTSVPG
jgi:peptidylprolyl isomerase